MIGPREQRSRAIVHDDIAKIEGLDARRLAVIVGMAQLLIQKVGFCENPARNLRLCFATVFSQPDGWECGVSGDGTRCLQSGARMHWIPCPEACELALVEQARSAIGERCESCTLLVLGPGTSSGRDMLLMRAAMRIRVDDEPFGLAVSGVLVDRGSEGLDCNVREARSYRLFGPAPEWEVAELLHDGAPEHGLSWAMVERAGEKPPAIRGVFDGH